MSDILKQEYQVFISLSNILERPLTCVRPFNSRGSLVAQIIRLCTGLLLLLVNKHLPEFGARDLQVENDTRDPTYGILK